VAVYLEPTGVYKSQGWVSTGANSIAVEMAQGVRYPNSPALKGGQHTSNPNNSGDEKEAVGNILSLIYPLLSSARGTPEKVSIWLYTNARDYGAFVEWYPVAVESSASFPAKKATGEWGTPGVAEPYVITSPELLADLVKAKEIQVVVKAEDRALGLIAATCYWEILYPGEFVPERRVGRPQTASVLRHPPRNAARLPSAPRQAQRIHAARTEAGGTLWVGPSEVGAPAAWSGSLASLQEGSTTQAPTEPPAGKGYKLIESSPSSRLRITLPLRPLAPSVALEGVAETAELLVWSQGPITWFWEARLGSTILLPEAALGNRAEAGVWMTALLPQELGRELLREASVVLWAEQASRVGTELRAAALRIAYTLARPLTGPSAALVPAVRHWAAVKQAPTTAIVRRASSRAVVAAPRTGVVLQPEHFDKS
jgi:hypothetical protein